MRDVLWHDYPLQQLACKMFLALQSIGIAQKERLTLEALYAAEEFSGLLMGEEGEQLFSSCSDPRKRFSNFVHPSLHESLLTISTSGALVVDLQIAHPCNEKRFLLVSCPRVSFGHFDQYSLQWQPLNTLFGLKTASACLSITLRLSHAFWIFVPHSPSIVALCFLESMSSFVASMEAGRNF